MPTEAVTAAIDATQDVRLALGSLAASLTALESAIHGTELADLTDLDELSILEEEMQHHLQRLTSKLEDLKEEEAHAQSAD